MTNYYHNGNIYKYKVLGEYDLFRVDFLLDKLHTKIYNENIGENSIYKMLDVFRRENIEMEVFLWK